MAQIISLVVYEINGVALKQTQTLGFSVDNFIVSPYTGTNASLNSTIEVLSDDASKTFSIVETQAALITAANSERIITSGNTPTIVASVPASVTVSVVGNDTSGIITVVNTASIPANSGGFMILTPSFSYGTVPKIFFQAANSAGANFANRLYLATGTTGTNLLIDTSSAISASTYKFSYLIVA